MEDFRRKIKIGDLLIEKNLISKEQFNRAITLQKETRRKLGEILVDLRYISEDKLLELLGQQLEMPIIDLAKFEFNVKLSSQLPEVYAIRYQCVLLKKEDDSYLVGMVDPLDLFALDEISRILKSKITVALVKKQELEKRFGFIYRRDTQITTFASELGNLLETTGGKYDTLLPAQLIDAPVKKFINALFEDAIQIHASDIHIEPEISVLRIRLRVDGVLQEQVLDQKNIASAITQHIKLMANLNIAEKRLPQDGRFSITIRNKVIDARLSTIPIQYGESVVIRLLDQGSERITLDKIGMFDSDLRQFRHLIHVPHGVILVTGPTGSGKSTTLYAALLELNKPQKKIITIEDPVEYELERVCQVQVKPKIGLDFARILRSILRQDPDIILVGEMRDNETASIAMRAALTGHMVLSTLHTNDAASTAVRLLDMGIPGYLVAATLQAVIAQRLIRKNCDHCREPYVPNAIELDWLSKITDKDMSQQKFYFGKGCTHCNKIGYSGRIGIYELLTLTPEMTQALVAEDENQFMLLAKKAMQKRSLQNQALQCALDGVTNLGEIMRASGEVF